MSGPDHGTLHQNLFDPTPTKLNEFERIIANPEGMTLALEYQGLQEELHTLRATISDEWSHYPTSHQAHGHRNAVAHGGNIVADIRAITFMEEWNPSRAERWRTGFAEYYGQDYRTCVERNVRLSDRKLQNIFNMNASVEFLYKWRTRARKEDKEVIEANCTSILGEWRGGAQDLFQEGRSETLENYRQTMQLYHK